MRVDAPPPADDPVEGEPVAPPPLPAEDEATRRAEGRSFPCLGCGADLAFSASAQQMRCPWCGHLAAIEAEGEVVEQELGAMLEKASRKRAAPEGDATLHEVGCDACGAKVQFAGALTAGSCPYCGRPIQRDGVHDAPGRLAVDGVVPFQVEADAARANLAKWTASRWFLPGELARDGIAAAFQGVYLPFFAFDALTANRFTGLRGDHYTVVIGSGKSRTVVRRTRWRPAAGSFRRFFDDELECAGSGLPDAQMRALEPWPLKGARPFRAGFLAGFLARSYERPLAECFAAAKQRMEAAIDAEVRQRIGGDAQRVLSLHTSWSALAGKHLLLPVWMASYRFKEKSYRIVVNAATGEVQGERPWSAAKIALLVLCVAAAAALAVLIANR